MTGLTGWLVATDVCLVSVIILQTISIYFLRISFSQVVKALNAHAKYLHTHSELETEDG
jgi:hypothetical protein